MNKHVEHSTSLMTLCSSVLENRRLIGQLIRRDVVGRYKGSFLGLGWSFLTPILMLMVYTFVFSVIFTARWGGDDVESKTSFALILFVGLIVHSLFAEVANRASGIILSNVNYVKKVVFPLEILPVVIMGSTLFHIFVSLAVLLGVFLLLNGFVYWTTILIPLIFLPLVMLTLGVAWFLASLGVYLRDVGQTIGIVTTVMLFMAPVFYPASMLPERYQTILLLNPLTFIIEQARLVLIFGEVPNWHGLIVYGVASTLVAWLGFFWFQKTRKGFADVL